MIMLSVDSEQLGIVREKKVIDTLHPTHTHMHTHTHAHTLPPAQPIQVYRLHCSTHLREVLHDIY